MIIHPQSKSVLLKTRSPELVHNLLTHVRDVDIKGHNLQIRHGLEETRVLRNIGVKVPPPIYYHYKWTGRHPEVWRHQKMTAAFMTLNPRGFVLNQQGTAKTACVLWATDYMMNEGLHQKVLIAAPLSTLSLVWQQEVFTTVPHRSCSVIYGSREKRLKLLGYGSDYYIVNHDGLQIIAAEVIARKDITALVLDESADYRNSRTAKWAVLNRIIRARPDMAVWLMSGMPTPQEPTDAYAQAKLLFPDRVPRFFGNFRRDVMLQVSPYKWIPREGAHDQVFKIMQPAIRFKKEDCLDLPPLVTEEAEAQLSKEQIEEFARMKKHMRMMAAGTTINAVNAADQITKLRQILCGVIKDPITGKYKPINFAPRLNVLIQLINQASHKVVVVVPFKGVLRFLVGALNHKGISASYINGDIPFAKRTAIVNRFKQEVDPRVLVIHPKVASHGVSFVEADTTVLYAPIYSNDQFQQVIERYNRPGKKHKMTLVRMGTHRIEWAIYKDTDARQNTQMSILDLYNSEVLGL
jgi:hypothetical protein